MGSSWALRLVANDVALLGLPYKARDGGDWRDAEIMTMEEVPMTKLQMPISALSCLFCLRPLKPPLYKCKGKHHVACADYHGDRQCQECDGDGGFNVHSSSADALYTDIKAECRHEGCGLYVSYYNLEDHQSACPFAPCKCYVPGCGYEGPPPALTHHLSTVHLMPEHRIQYGKVLQLQVPVSGPQHLLLAEEDSRAFFMVDGALSMYAPIAVSVICIRAGASPPPYYAAKVWANGPPGTNGRTDAVELEIEMTSSKEPSAVAVEELTFLTVPPMMLAGAGSSRTVSLHIRIDKLTS